MATTRKFAYNTGSQITGATQYGSLAIGVTLSSFSDNPGGVKWWGGPDEDLGYVIAHTVPSGNQPNPNGLSCSVGFWRTNGLNDQNFLTLVRQTTGQSFATASNAATWLNTNGYWTSFGGIVTNGLTLRLDASNSTSYPGSGSTWVDLVEPQQNITLVNSPTYTSASPAYFTFNSGSNQYGSGSGAVLGSTSYTKSAWFYLNSYTTNNIVSSSNAGHYMFFNGGDRLYSGHTDWAGFPTTYPSTATFSLNTWYNVALTFNTTDGMKLYINGNLDSSYATIKTGLSGNNSVDIASYANGNLLNGRMARVYCYNISISASEVLQNFNTEKSLFGY